MEGMQREWIPESARVVTFVGAGGKTGLMMELAQEYAKKGRRVIVTTSTHMFFPGTDAAKLARQYPEEMEWVIFGDQNLDTKQGTVERSREDSEEWWKNCSCRIREYLAEGKVVLTACPDPKNPWKIAALPETYRKELTSLADLCLVEGDGSARKPVKIPRAWEPVIPEESDVTVAVLGMSALDQKIEDVSYVPEEMAAFLGKTREDILTKEDLLRILTHPAGLKKGSCGQYYVILNQADTVELRKTSEDILRELRREGIPGHWSTRRTRLGLVLLAAGLSRRFTGAEKMKAKLSDGKTLYEHAMELAEKIPAYCHVFVTKEEELRGKIEGRSFLCQGDRLTWQAVVNPMPERGIASSMQCGIQASEDVDGWLFMVCDQPGLSEGLVLRIIEAWRECRGDIISASCMGVPGNPKLFSAVFGEELMALSGDTGGRQILKNHRSGLWFEETLNSEELFDIDTKEDLDRIDRMR